MRNGVKHPEVRNLRNTKEGLRCDRGTALGNPFFMKNEKERDLVCDAFDKYLSKFVYSSNPTLTPADAARHAAKLTGATIAKTWREPSREALWAALDDAVAAYPTPLLCWCAPKRCHCETIAMYIAGWVDSDSRDYPQETPR